MIVKSSQTFVKPSFQAVATGLQLPGPGLWRGRWRLPEEGLEHWTAGSHLTGDDQLIIQVV